MSHTHVRNTVERSREWRRLENPEHAWQATGSLAQDARTDNEPRTRQRCPVRGSCEGRRAYFNL